MLVRNALAMSAPSIASAQKTVTKSDKVTAMATIVAIDSTTHSVTLRDEKGNEDTYDTTGVVKRFDELKVGDKVKMTYYESLVFQLRKPGEKVNPESASVAAARAKGAPGGTMATQQTTTVTVKAVDPSVPSITVLTADGRTVTRKIEDKKNLEGVKAGDKIDITYTQALIATVEKSK